ncbi:MAG: hypothetical protein RQ752_08785, partial [Thermohalobaculum sp.]|nr:hypothetical protein [Thermohalobaculum sp.]
LLALDGIVTVPRSELSYATGTTAQLSAPALGLDLVIVAEDLGGGLTLLRDLRGPVGLLRHRPDGRVDLALENGDRFEGESRAIGFRRGRLAEQIGLADQDGRRLTLMIGFSPEELASGAGGTAAERPKG